MRAAFKLILGAILALSTMELVALRVFNFELANDPLFGVIVNPGHTVYSRIEGYGKAHYVEHGVRRSGPWDPSGPAPILVVGDSYTEAHQVNDEEVFTSLLEKQLRRDGLIAPVLNFGAGGYSVADYVNLIPKLSSYFKARWVIVQVRDDDFTTDAWSKSKTHFERKADGSGLKVVSPPKLAKPPKRWVRWLVNNIALVSFTLERVSLYRAGLADDPALFRAGQHQTVEDSKSAETAMNYPIKQEMELLDEACGHRLTILLVAGYDPNAPLARTMVERILLEQSENLKIDLVDLRAEYPRMAKNGLSPFGFRNTFFNSGHWNADGHAAAAKLLAEDLLRRRTDGLF